MRHSQNASVSLMREETQWGGEERTRRSDMLNAILVNPSAEEVQYWKEWITGEEDL